MPKQKKCAICDEPITGNGRKYCADCKDWERQANREANAMKADDCDHVIAYDRDIYDGTSMLVYLSAPAFDSDVYDTDFRYCPMCGECIRDEAGKLIVGKEEE